MIAARTAKILVVSFFIYSDRRSNFQLLDSTDSLLHSDSDIIIDGRARCSIIIEVLQN